MSIDFLSKKLPNLAPDLATVIEEMRVAVRQADSIVHGLLDFAAIQSLAVTVDDLNSVINQALKLLTISTMKHNITVVDSWTPHSRGGHRQDPD